MTPYYQDDAVTIYHADARDYELDDPEGCVLVTDPPYGTHAYATDVSVAEWLSVQLSRWPSAAVFGWPEDLVRLCMAAGRAPDEWVTWWPTNASLKGWNGREGLPRESEHIAIFGPVGRVYGAPRSASSVRIVERMGNDAQHHGARARHHHSPNGKQWGDVWRDAAPGLAFQSHRRRHPNEKPLDLMVRLLQVVVDGTVIDPFMGSGTTLEAAKRLGRQAIGIEIEERYCEVAANRCRQEVMGLVS